MPPRTRLLGIVAIAIVIAAALYVFKIHKPASTSPPAAAVTVPTSFVTSANAVCLQETRDGVRPPAARRTGSRASFASLDTAVRASVQDLPKLLVLTPPPAQAAIWDRFLHVNGDTLNGLIRLRALVRRHAGHAQLAPAAAALTPLYALQDTLAAQLVLTACGTPHPAP